MICSFAFQRIAHGSTIRGQADAVPISPTCGRATRPICIVTNLKITARSVVQILTCRVDPGHARVTRDHLRVGQVARTYKNINYII